MNEDSNRFQFLRTGGKGTEPVIVVYCLKISLGFGPRKKNPSKMPDSNIQCVVTSGSSVFSFKRKYFPIDENNFLEGESKINEFHAMRKRKTEKEKVKTRITNVLCQILCKRMCLSSA